MSIWIYSHVWIFSENPEDLNKITDDELEKLAIGSPKDLKQSVEIIKSKYPKDSVTISKLVNFRKSLAGKIKKRQPLILEIVAGGKYGHCLYALELSHQYDNLYFVEISGCDVNSFQNISLIKNGKRIINKKIVSHNPDRTSSLHDSINCLTYSNMEISFQNLSNKLISEDLYWEDPENIQAVDLILQTDPEV